MRRRSFMPASSYYTLSAAAAFAVFFVLWSLLHEEGEDMPWIGAGLGASVVLGSAVLVRELLVARANRRMREAERQLDHSLSAFPPSLLRAGGTPKLTIEKNAALLRHIKKKSDAAKVLGKLPEGHREVFDLCEEYLRLVAEELPTVAVGSPRIAAFRHGNELVRGFHRFHLMQWAGIEARALTQQANNRDKIADRLKVTQQAMEVVDFALRFYPNEPELIDSLVVLNGLSDSLKVKDLIEKAERSVARGNRKRARTLYADALYVLDTADPDNHEAAAAAERIRIEIERLDVDVGNAE